MRNTQGTILFSFLSMIFLTTSCIDPTDLGSDLLREDRAEVNFIDTLTIRASTIRGEAPFVYGPAIVDQQSNYLVGKMTDPIFGLSEAVMYGSPRLDFFGPDFSNTELDSIVLFLPYNRDSLAFYGRWNEEFSLDVFRVTERIDRNRFYTADTSFAVNPLPLGSKTFAPRPFDSLEVAQYNGTSIDTITFPPHLRIPLSAEFGNEFLQLDSLILDNDDAFLDYFNGFQVKASSTNRGLLSFNLLNTIGGIYVYYTKDDTLKRQFLIQMDQFSSRFSTFEHDYSGSVVENFIGAQHSGDSLLFVQGLAGVETRIELPYVRNLEDLIINQAELIVEFEDLPEDVDSIYAPALQLGLFTERGDGVREGVRDFALANALDDLSRLFGGVLSDPSNRSGTYTMNLSSHFQKMVTGEVDNVLYLVAFPKSERAYRSVLKGTNSIKLNIAYSRLN